MRWVIMHPQGVSAALKKPHPLQSVLNFIGETPAVSREKRLSIYGNAYYLRIIEVLGANFSSVRNVVGGPAFHRLARAYLVRYPSTFKSIDDIGHRLPGFLRRHSLTKRYGFLPDLATLEWATHCAFFADDRPRRALPLDPSVKLLTLDWPVDRLWRSDGKWSPAQLRKLKKTRQNALVFRTPEKFLRVHPLNPIQCDLLRQIGKGKSLKKSILFILTKHKEDADKIPIGAWFREWAENGVFTNKLISYPRG